MDRIACEPRTAANTKATSKLAPGSALRSHAPPSVSTALAVRSTEPRILVIEGANTLTEVWRPIVRRGRD